MTEGSGTSPQPSGTGHGQARDPEPPSRSQHQPSPKSEKDVVQRTLQALTLAGLGLYGAIRFGQQLYCDGLGITPEEIGLTYTASISRAAVILIALAAPLVSFALLILANAVIGGTDLLSTIVEYTLYFISIGIAVLVLTLANMVLGSPLSEWQLLFTGLLLYSAAWLLAVILQPERWRRLFLGRIKLKVERVAVSYRSLLIVPGLIASVIVASFLTTGFVARGGVDDVRNGRSPEPRQGLGMLGLKAQPVSIIGSAPKELGIEKRKLMYLGRGDGRVVVFDISCGQPLRLPDAELSLVMIDGFPAGASTSCIASRALHPGGHHAPPPPLAAASHRAIGGAPPNGRGGVGLTPGAPSDRSPLSRPVQPDATTTVVG